MPSDASPAPSTPRPRETGPRSASETRARIIQVAQEVFAAQGYSHAGLRAIAREAEVAPSLVIKYFGTKAGLFEEALVAAILPIEEFQQDRARLGANIVAAIRDPGARMLAPAMIALALGDPESRHVAERVVETHVIGPMSRWLGADARAEALNLLAMSTGFAIFQRSLGHLLAADEVERSAQLLARSLQDLTPPG